MAQNTNNFSDKQKCSYYEKRVNNPKLTEGQRKYAERRLNALCGSGSGSASSSSKSGFTDGQRAAFSSGIDYGAAKSGKRVPVREENKDSFRAGVERGRRL